MQNFYFIEDQNQYFLFQILLENLEIVLLSWNKRLFIGGKWLGSDTIWFKYTLEIEQKNKQEIMV